MKNAFVFASFFAFASIAAAQTTAQPATGSVAGQASTESATGVPNPTQRPDGSMPKARADVKAGARGEAGSPQTTKVPSGQASTMIQGRPNAAVPVDERSRAAVRNETKKSMNSDKMGRAGEADNVPTNPKDNRLGTPK
ncbi:MAG: serine/threonine protein kinase [Variovorax sp.]